jgi:nitrogen fixation protein NifU and related proteins
VTASTDALYQELILDHNRKPRNFGEIVDADRVVDGHNPMCGDEVKVFLKLDGDRIADVKFTSPPGRGCAISKASASLMTTAMKGKSRADAELLFENFHKLVRGEMPEEEQRAMGSLRAFGSISRYPQRVKCASLAWHALHSALEAGPAEVSTDTDGPAIGEGA